MSALLIAELYLWSRSIALDTFVTSAIIVLSMFFIAKDSLFYLLFLAVAITSFIAIIFI